MIGSLEIAVVVVDQSMQEMDVLDFLKNLSVKSPYTMVIIMTGYSGIEETFDTIYSGSNYRFVKKPLVYNEIKQAVKSAIAEYEINLDNKRWAVS
jgi:DNA-binding NtrC family response regulator